jgi:hypothetical protein
MIHLEIIESDSRDEFVQKVEEFINSHHVLNEKFQRNLYYSLSGTMGKPEEFQPKERKLEQNYLSYLIWVEDSVDETFDFDDDAFDGET